MKKTLFFLGLLSIAIIPAFIGIFHPGFFVTDDGNWMVIRLSAFYEAMRQGQFPVRFLPRLNNGFGYPVADFLYPLFLYIGSFIHLFHITFVETVKLLFGLSLFGGAVGTFLWFRKNFGNLAGFVGALIYTLFPYHIWDITKRGSLGEVLALGVVPYIFWQIDRKNIIFSSVGIALLILAHNSLALVFLPVIIGYFILKSEYKNGFINIFLGLGLSAFFWFPALFDKQFTVFDTRVVSNYSQYFLINNLYPLIGTVSFIILIFSLFLVFKYKEKKSAFFLVLMLVSITLTLPISNDVWQILPLGKYVQFPFRFLSLTTLSAAFLSAYTIKSWDKRHIFILSGLLIIFIYISSWQYLFPKEYNYYPDTFYSTNQDSTTVQNEYMPIWAKKMPAEPHPKVTVSNGIIRNSVDKGSSIDFDVQALQSSVVTVAIAYFPGWKATVDGKEVDIRQQTTTGFINLSVSNGNHHVQIEFSETAPRMIADIISLFSAVILIVMVFLPMVRLKRKKT